MDRCVDIAQLIAFEDGRLTAKERECVLSHLSICEKCYEQLVRIHKIYNTITYYFKSLPETENCQKATVWKDYLNGLLTDSQHEKLASHLVECDHCFDIVSSILGSQIHHWNLERLMKDISSEFEKVRYGAEEMLRQIGNWIENLLPVLPDYATARVRTRGYAKSSGNASSITKENKAVLKVKPFNELGVSVKKPIVFDLISGPELDENQNFNIELSTPALEYEGYLLCVSLKKDNQYLDLGVVPLKLAENILEARMSIDLKQTKINIGGKRQAMPLDYIELSIHKQTNTI